MSDATSSWTIPKGRKLRNCDAIAVPVYDIDKQLLAAVFKPTKCVQTLVESTAPKLSAAHLQTLASEHPSVVERPTHDSLVCQRGNDSSTLSEGIDLTAEELKLIEHAAPDSDSDEWSVNGDQSDDNAPNQGAFVQANGSTYHALALEHLQGGVGLGISRAFRSTQECKGRHAVLLLSADRFAACFFGHDGRVEEHKVCKRYVVRGKQGGAQSSHDNGGKGKASSAGSNMRREGAKKLGEDVAGLMSKWSEKLRLCDVIFVSCPPTQKSVLFSDVISRTDQRVRKIPFCGIGKPSLESCIQAHSLVCSALYFRSWPRSASVADIPLLSVPRQCGEKDGIAELSGKPGLVADSLACELVVAS